MKVKVHVIKSFEELLEVFPSMTMPQVITTYISGLEHIKKINDSLGICTDGQHQDALLGQLAPYLEADAFLSGYLARCYCKMLGYGISDI